MSRSGSSIAQPGLGAKSRMDAGLRLTGLRNGIRYVRVGGCGADEDAFVPVEAAGDVIGDRGLAQAAITGGRGKVCCHRFR